MLDLVEWSNTEKATDQFQEWVNSYYKHAASLFSELASFFINLVHVHCSPHTEHLVACFSESPVVEDFQSTEKQLRPIPPKKYTPNNNMNLFQDEDDLRHDDVIDLDDSLLDEDWNPPIPSDLWITASVLWCQLF